jgi:tRNA G18 (ribose-2'-O)-methylase SpoU
LTNTPNIAGLVRTAEIFNLDRLVISNDKILKTNAFKKMTVSAGDFVCNFSFFLKLFTYEVEKHLTIVEVKLPKLVSYLEEKRSQGYRIIAVEQSSTSTSLEKFKFPKKAVLLLGSEQEGSRI